MVFSRPTVPAARRALRTYIARNAARRHPLLNLLFVLAARCALRTYIAHAVAGLESGKAFDSGVATRRRVSALLRSLGFAVKPRSSATLEAMEFERAPAKAAANLRKHNVSFVEAVTVFADFFSATLPDRPFRGRIAIHYGRTV
jgi:hypothetical protein